VNQRSKDQKKKRRPLSCWISPADFAGKGQPAAPDEGEHTGDISKGKLLKPEKEKDSRTRATMQGLTVIDQKAESVRVTERTISEKVDERRKHKPNGKTGRIFNLEPYKERSG